MGIVSFTSFLIMIAFATKILYDLNVNDLSDTRMLVSMIFFGLNAVYWK